ncbi:MAG TPA: alanine racemase [Xanthomonadaceae bacterium]|nr:alanine racemase [Xanthomonadaceae bacterium]
MSRATAATIHVDALRHNLARMRELAPDSRVMAVVKADGYGHGLERVGRALSGADAFGVAALSDAERLRAIGLPHRIVLLSGFDEPADLPVLQRLSIDTVVHHAWQLELLEAAQRQASPERARLRVWLKIDSGMHRLGFPAAQAAQVHRRLRDLAWVDPEIVLMSHFASSDVFEGEATRAQIARFQAATRGLPGPHSLANSAAVLGWRQVRNGWIRPGGALYGISVVPGTTGADFGLAPAMTLATRLIAIHHVAAGEAVGYGGGFLCPEDMPVGVAAIGYGDGYPRAAGSGTPVLVAGRRAPLIGRVSMDLITIDLRGLPEARIGDEVVLWGRGLPVEEIAQHAGTIGYELSCGITRRVRFSEA